MIPAHIPERLKACVTTHRIMDDTLSPAKASARNFELIKAALESMPIGKQFGASDLRKATGEPVCWDSIRNHLAAEVVRRSVVTYKTGQNRYYKRVA